MYSTTVDLPPPESAELTPSRQTLLARRQQAQKEASALVAEARTLPPADAQVSTLLRQSQDRQFTCEYLDGLLRTAFMPAHGARQLISPRVFFLSPLFRVAGKKDGRENQAVVDLKSSAGDTLMRYTGPELRQSDGLVFMALLNLARDVKVGEPVAFSPKDVCLKLFNRYDGPSRSALKAHIKRLQRGLMELETFSVQLCLRFDHPKTGLWRVALDPDIIELFQRSSEVWLDLDRRRELPEGLATWLYGFVESQSRLIPTPAETLRMLCGSSATPDSFLRTLRQALHELDQLGVIASGWSVSQGVVRWMKLR